MSSTHGKTVRIYLADGSPAGIRHAEVVNWTGQAIVCPRGRVGELSDWPEAHRPGVYILLGENPKSSKPMAYIGEAEHVHTRLKQHVTYKDFWDQVVFFTSKDENLTKSHVKYLESRMVDLAVTAKRMELENGNAPTQSTLPRPDRAAMEEFLGPARILLGALGFTLLEPVKGPIGPNDEEMKDHPLASTTLFFEMSKSGVKATGASGDEGFVVFGGSVGSAVTVDSLSSGYEKLRETMLDDGRLKRTADAILVSRDILFNSPSAAAAVLRGAEKNGRTCWKDKNGKTLAELEEALLNTTEDEGSV